MCGRYVLRNAPDDADMSWREYRDRIGGLYEYPRYNICPSQQCIVLRYDGGDMQADKLKWGFKPAWSKYQPSINARAEGLLESKMFKGATRHKRCLVLADGFYEPKGPSSEKHRPWYFFQYSDKRVFAMAGIWTEGGFAIVTNDANEQVALIHNRMPHILNPDHWQSWLSHEVVEDSDIHLLLAQNDYQGLEKYAVGNFVKKPGNEGLECITHYTSVRP